MKPLWKSFTIQYNDSNQWNNYTDDEGNAIEFFTLPAAKSVAKDLAASGAIPNISSQKNDWQITDSHGNVFNIC